MEKKQLVKASDLNFNARHNYVKCIESLRPEDKGTERQYWFTRQMLAEVLGVSAVNTIANHIDVLLRRGAIEGVKNLITSEIPTNGGVQKTTLYDLKCFNLLAMRLDTDRAWEMKERFNDVLVHHETGAQQPQLPKTYLEALEALVASEKSRLALLAENATLKAQNGVLSQDYVSNKDVCLQLLAKGLAKKKNGQDYALSTLLSKVSPILRRLSNENGYSVSEQIVVVEGVERKTPYYHIDVRDMVIDIFEKQAKES